VYLKYKCNYKIIILTQKQDDKISFHNLFKVWIIFLAAGEKDRYDFK
jgi:hypothetical protein